MVKNLPASAGDGRDVGSIPGSGRPPGGGHGNPLQDSCLENALDRGVWWAAVPGVTKSQTRLKRLSTQAADSHLAFGGTQHSLSRPGLTGSLEKGLPASHFTVTQAMRKAGSWGPARPWGLGAHVPGSSRGRRRGRDRPGEPGLGGRRGWAGVHTVRVTHGLGLRGQAVLHGAGEKGGEPAPPPWTWVYLRCELEWKSEGGRLKPDGAGPGWGEAEPRRE